MIKFKGSSSKPCGLKKLDVWVSMAVMTKSYIDLNSNLKHTPQYGQRNFNKSVWLVTNTTTASKCIPKRTRICINWNPPFQAQIYLVKVPLNVNIVTQDLLHKNSFWKFYEVRFERGISNDADSGPPR